jgi:hypothetical protein
MTVSRVTRLGEFSPLGRLFSMGSFSSNRSNPIFGPIFHHGKKSFIKVDEKCAGLHFGRYFLQTHPVTLTLSDKEWRFYISSLLLTLVMYWLHASMLERIGPVLQLPRYIHTLKWMLFSESKLCTEENIVLFSIAVYFSRQFLCV